MKAIFREDGKDLGTLYWNGETMEVSEGFPKILLENLLEGIEPKKMEKGVPIYGKKLTTGDGERFLAALPTIFYNNNLNARLEF